MAQLIHAAAAMLAVYIMARLIIMAYFAERSAHIQQILKMQKELSRNNG